MIDRRSRLLCAAFLGGVACVSAGCQTTPAPPPNYGQTGGRMDPTHDAPSELGTLELHSQDLVTATDQMAMDIASRLDITNRVDPPRIFVGRIENETSQPARNYQIFLNRLRAQLLASGARHGLDMRRESEFVETQRNREFGTKQPDRTAAAYQSQNEYVLTCIVQDLPTNYTNYYLLEYQLVQLVDYAETGPNVGPGAIVWSNFYEVKFQ
ncbi:MAG: hypothetical protein KC983_09140 [Phycisphaerales bacterium]|nr:hypothetical protein [Phycisphaerales bacterium]